MLSQHFLFFFAMLGTFNGMDMVYRESKNPAMQNFNPEGPQDEGMAPLLDLVLKHVPEPTVADGQLIFQVSSKLRLPS